MHRIGGLEKQDITGNVNYEPANHEHMVNLRARKFAGIATRHSAAGSRQGPPSGKLLVMSWGGTYGAAPRPSQPVRGRADPWLTPICAI